MNNIEQKILSNLRADDPLLSMAVALSAYDDNMRILYFNQNYVEMFSYPVDAVSIGVSIESLMRILAERGDYGPGDVEAIVRERINTRRQPGKRRIEWLRTTDRVIEMFWRQVEGIGNVTFAIDATDRSQAVKVLQESEFLIGNAFDHLPVGISMTEPGGRFLMVNSTYATWAKDDAKAMVGKTFYDFCPAELADSIVAEENHVLETGDESISEVTRTFRDGVTRSILVHKRPVRLGTEAIFAVASVLTDISDRKRSEDALRESENLFRAFMDHSDPWWCLGSGGNLKAA